MNTRTLDVALRIAADLDGAAKEVDALSGSLDGVKGAGQNAAQGLNAAATASGKSSAANQANAAAAKAASTAQTALGAATQKTSAIQQRAAMTAGELRNAQRQLPMQITDIVTGLASGQSVFMVAIQQGGQLRDAWGGIVPAGRALLGTITPMVAAVSAGAAAFAVLGMALYEVAQDEKAVNDALLTTGNYVNTTAASVDAMVGKLAELQGVTEGGARDALLAVAQSGRITGEQFERVATVAARMEAAVGQSIDTTVEKFEAIAKSPVEALLKLNETEHFLTEAQLERVRALVEEGREQDAVAEGARIYADRLDDIADAAEVARPHLARMWQDAKEGAASAWEETKNFAEFLAAAGAKFNELPWYMKFGPTAGISAIRALYQAEPAQPGQVASVAGAVDSEAERKRDKDRKQAEQEWARLQQSNLSKEQKLEAEIVEIRKTGVALGKNDAEIEAQIAQARARYKESLPKGRKGDKTEAQKDQEAAARELANLERQIALAGALADGEKRVSEEARVRYEVENGAYKLASAATQQQLIDQAKLLDARRAEREEAEKKAKADEDARRAYDRLRAELATPVESTLQQITDQVKTLNDALRVGGEKLVPEYQAQLARIFDGAYTKAPKFQSPYAGQDDLTGLLGDQTQFDGYLQRLQDWYQKQQDIVAQGRAENAALNAQWDAQEERARIEHAARLQELTQAQHQMQLAATASIFDSMAQIAYNAAGEQSRAYQVLFAISKGFAVAQAAVALAQNVAEASKVGFPQNLPLIAAAFAQGAQITAILSGANFRPGGYADGGYTGPGGKYQPAGIVHKGEGVLSQEDMRALGGPAGFYALRHAIHNGYAEGGLVMPAERAEPLVRLQAPPAPSVHQQASMRAYLYQDIDQLRAAILNHPAAEKMMVATIGDNGQAIQASWGNG
ncbi:phage tail length tape measure family protein [Thermomonas sp.]|uniref:phage tail length tape measure family protein n=1 Tax=Thermomonas sp. TaxID=1971895 RepID=UPI00391BDE7E